MSTQDKQSKRSKFVGKLLVAAMSGALASTALIACENSGDSAKPADTTATTPTTAEPAKADPAAAQPGAAAVKTGEEAKAAGNSCSGANGCGAAKEGEAGKEGANGCGAAKEGEAGKEGANGCGGTKTE